MLHFQIIEQLNNFLKNYFNLQHMPLKSKDKVIFSIEGVHEAVNYRRSDSTQVKTLHWFDNFFLYIEVKFSPDYTYKFISLSVFQG